MAVLSDPESLVVERTYRILKGWGEGQIGDCLAVRESAFGDKWGEIRTPVGTYWTRWQLLELVETP